MIFFRRLLPVVMDVQYRYNRSCESSLLSVVSCQFMKVFYQEESMCHHIHTHLTFSKGRVAQKSLKLSCLLSQNGGVLDCHSVGERKVKEEGEVFTSSLWEEEGSIYFD